MARNKESMGDRGADGVVSWSDSRTGPRSSLAFVSLKVAAKNV